MKLKKSDLDIMAHLRKNARERLTTISKKTKIPVSTIFDRMTEHYGKLMLKNTILLDFVKLGFNARANIMMKVEKKLRKELKEFLFKHLNVNSLWKINNGYDFMIEVVFKDIKNLEGFLEEIDEKFSVEKDVYYIIEDMRREEFLSQPESMQMVDI